MPKRPGWGHRRGDPPPEARSPIILTRSALWTKENKACNRSYRSWAGTRLSQVVSFQASSLWHCRPDQILLSLLHRLLGSGLWALGSLLSGQAGP